MRSLLLSPERKDAANFGIDIRLAATLQRADLIASTI